MPSHEFSLPTHIKGLAIKRWARFRHWKGAVFDTHPENFPKSSQINSARKALVKISDRSQNLELKNLAKQVKEVMDNIYFALIVPDLKLRDRLLTETTSFLKMSYPFRDGIDRNVYQREKMYESAKRTDNCQAHLESAAFRLNNCMYWLHQRDNMNSEIIDNLQGAIQAVLEADKVFPLLEIDGW